MRATVQITLPDERARQAASAGLLAPEAMENPLREELRRRAGEALQRMWKQMPEEELTPENEDEIAEAVREARIKKSRHKANQT